jgi:hypothetical protein
MRTSDRYEGCLPEIAEALKAKLICHDVWVWDDDVAEAVQHTIVTYFPAPEWSYLNSEYIGFTHASLTDPRIPAKPAWTYPLASDDTPIDAPVWARNSRAIEWIPRHYAKTGRAWSGGGTSHTSSDTCPWNMIVLVDPDNLRQPPPDDHWPA